MDVSDGKPKGIRIPMEIIYEIMSSLLPEDKTSLIPPSHPATQLLLSFRSVSCATNAEAVRLFKQHCIFLDSYPRLIQFVLCAEESRALKTTMPSIFRDIEVLYLEALPITGLVAKLFSLTSKSLRRLVLHFPHGGFCPIWRDELHSLDNLEEFVCSAALVRWIWEPEYIIRYKHGDVWELPWPNLKHMEVIDVHKMTITTYKKSRARSWTGLDHGKSPGSRDRVTLRYI
ncbi:hypothetical protein GGR54DRAFT_647205 [Hypoxylon sp. NC1633]|nr:hypothetical protein GGR54DRAFT_647205 [Hypoxylon sp. NC1633]